MRGPRRFSRCVPGQGGCVSTCRLISEFFRVLTQITHLASGARATLCPAICWCFLNPNTPILGQARPAGTLTVPPPSWAAPRGRRSFQVEHENQFFSDAVRGLGVPRAEVTRLCEIRRCGFDSPRGRAPSPCPPRSSGGRRGLWLPAASCLSLGLIAASGT